MCVCVSNLAIYSLSINVSLQCLKMRWLLFESVGGVGEVSCDVNMNSFNKLLNVENVHPQCDNLLKNDNVQLGAIKVQI